MVGGRYELGTSVHRGPGAELFEARDLELGRDVLVRIVGPQGAVDPARLRRTREGTRLATRVLHPNVLTVFDAGVSDGRTFLVIERPDGPSLAGLLDGSPMPGSEVVRLGLDVLAGLEAIHEHGIVLGDLSPRSVFRSADGRWKIPGTRGVASDPLEGPPATDPASFRAPESDRTGPTRAADLFAIGALLFAAASGNADRRPRLRQLRPDLASALTETIERAIAADPDARFPTATEMAEALRAGRTFSDPGAPMIELTSPAAVVDLTGPEPLLDVTDRAPVPSTNGRTGAPIPPVPPTHAPVPPADAPVGATVRSGGPRRRSRRGYGQTRESYAPASIRRDAWITRPAGCARCGTPAPPPPPRSRPR